MTAISLPEYLTYQLRFVQVPGEGDIPISEFGQLLEILWGKTVGCGPDIQFKHPSSGVDVGKWDVDTFLESYHQLSSILSRYWKEGKRTGRRTVAKIEGRRNLDLPTLDSWVELPRDIRCAQNQYTSIIVTNTVNLYISTALGL